MLQEIPIALERDTIYECLLELRFAPGHTSAEELLPGLLFGALKPTFTSLTALPLAQLPKGMRAADPQLAFQPVNALEGKYLRLMLGARVATLSFTGQYLGWVNVLPTARRCVNAILETGHVGDVERCSLKYVNLLTDGEAQAGLDLLDLQFRLNGFVPRGPGTLIRTELEVRGFRAIVEIMTDITITPPPDSGRQKASGVLVNVDVIHLGPFERFAHDLEANLNALHEAEKTVFFNILKRSTIERLGPTWREQ